MFYFLYGAIGFVFGFALAAFAAQDMTKENTILKKENNDLMDEKEEIHCEYVKALNEIRRLKK